SAFGDPAATLKRSINAEVRAAKSAAGEVGVHVMAVEDGREIYAYRAERTHILASNTKLFTSAAALDHLGPGYFFETTVKMRGETVDGVLRGDVGVVGGGDPNISGRQFNGDSFAVFRKWAQALRDLGVRRISGELVLAAGLFDDQYVHPDWPRNQLDRWYQAPVAALSFNDNCSLVKVEPMGGVGGAPRISMVPDVPFMAVRGKVQRTSKSRNQSVNIGRNPHAATLKEQRTIKVGGRIYRGSEQVDKWVTVDDPVAYFGASLRTAFRQFGIRVDGEVVVQDRLEGAAWRTVAVHRSDVLSTLEVVNKRSQNFYAESVLKLLGARYCGRGTWPGGVDVVSDFLRSAAGLDDFTLADGSGMSRGNRSTPRQLTLLLRHMFYHRWGGEFVRTLPFSGEKDLRWSTRLAEEPYRGNVLAKTGSLNGVSTLSGYAKGVSGEIYAFSILMNKSRAGWRSKKAQDAILRALIANG
ncbi:MAG: D-alanyl-D-alanine carboxypeptidase/D-alanyl-D-alanine-endopeptidase, partial [Acidobacteriota bacterium]